MKTSLPRLQYITDSPRAAEEACAAGVEWVQARIKNKNVTETKEIAKDILAVCRKYGATCIVNDFLDIALEIEAHGVHLGKEDTEIYRAKELIGKRNFILGGTANTMEDVRKLGLAQVSYIGLGPFRFTSTKEKLSPVLGAEGYKRIVQEVFTTNIFIPPIYAIGGILPGDTEEIIRTGVYGLVVSGAISKAVSKEKVIREFGERTANAISKHIET